MVINDFRKIDLPTVALSKALYVMKEWNGGKETAGVKLIT